MTLQIVLPAGPEHRPGRLLRAEIRWDCPQAPRGGVIVLGWATAGKGLGDAEIVSQVELASLPRVEDGAPAPLQASDARVLELRLPTGPYSFSGALISLRWSLAVRLDPQDEIARVELILGPEGEALRL